MLESQQDALSDFKDMQALRLYKARLVDYIEAHSKAGHLPPDPFQVIQQRLIAVSGFFTAADQEYKRFTSWKKSWIKGIPNISLSDVQSARSELSDLVAELPHVQQSLWHMLSAQDWDTSSSTVDLNPELLVCAQCVNGLKLPNKQGRRHELYQFARGEGELAHGVSTHLTAMDRRIEELSQLHAVHAQHIANAEIHALNHDLRSAEKIFHDFGKDRFSDLDYSVAETPIAELSGFLKQLKIFETSLDKQLKKYDLKIVKGKLDHLRTYPRSDSELGRECLVLCHKMASKIASAQKKHKQRKVTLTVVISLFIAVVAATSLFNFKASARAKREAAAAKAASVIALAEAERVAAKSKARFIELYPNFFGKRAGEEKVIEIAANVTMTFCWCPAGKFTMGRPKSEAGRSDNENQVEVILSRGFWMAKTEVTQAQWQAVMGNNPRWDNKGANRPVEK
jgi:hypothetical protein